MDNLTGELLVEAHAATDWPQVAGIWAEVAAESPYTTFFLSPEWVGAWIEVFGASLPVEILVFRSPQRAVGICLLVRRTLSHGPIRIRCVFLNTAGENENESPIVEFNNLLCLADWEQAIATALISYIKMQPWDEIWLNGFCQGLPLDALRRASSGLTVQRSVRATFFVDLKRIRESGAAYETFLRSTGRARLRQSLRAWGETEVVTPEGFPDALRMLHDLVELHTTTWRDRGQPGAFASPVFRAFHESLIRRCIPIHGIQLLRVQASTAPVGILYNVVHRGKVYFYQSGLAYSTNKRVRPGFVCLARAIHYCLDQPSLEEFNFMAGGDHYKEPMSTDHQELEWIVLRDSTLKNKVISWLRKWKRRLSRRRLPERTVDQTES